MFDQSKIQNNKLNSCNLIDNTARNLVMQIFVGESKWNLKYGPYKYNSKKGETLWIQSTD